MADLVRQMNLKRIPANRKLIGWVFGITGVLSLFFWWRGGSRVGLVLPEFEPMKISYTVEQKKVGGEWDASRTTAKLISQLRQKISQAQGRYGVYVFRLDKKTGYGIDGDEEMPAASIMKVPIMLAVWQAIEDGRLAWDTKYILQERDKQSGSGPIEFMDVGTALSVRQLVEEMIKKSDNTAPVVLTGLVGREEIEKEIERLGMEKTDFDKNITTAYDVGLMWRKIYGIKDKEMMALLKDSIYEDRLPAGVPEEINVLHKVGTGDNVWGDAGIIQCSVLSAQCSTKPFILVILNEGVDMDEAKKLVPELTKLIWDFEAGNGKKE